MENTSTIEGERIVKTICIRCHYNPNTLSLSGFNHANPERIGHFWSSNITGDSLFGIGSWTKRDLVYFLRFGVNPDGDFVFDMPKYVHLSDQDMSSLVSFLKSDDPLVKPTPFKTPSPEYSLPMRLLMSFWLRPPSWKPKPVLEPDKTNQVAWGRYLAVAKFACFDCHSGNSMTNNHLHPENSWRFFEGGSPHANEFGEKIVSANLTQNDVSVIINWSENDFVRCLRTGIRPDGSTVRDPMFPFSMLTEDEARAIYQYLLTL
ncbi:MAG: hypothetical protein K9G41_00965 [Flavobacteriales bacterium]|nr:hypothetical protein [Flavobacteriales bacterium]